MFKIIFIILKRKKYLITAVLLAVLLFVLSYFLTVINVFQKSIKIYADMNGTGYTVATLFLSAVMSIFFGIYGALMFFKFDLKTIKTKSDKITTSGGGALGVAASGCPSCGSPILGLFGAPLSLMALPFRGLEIKLFSILLLFLSIYLINKNIRGHLLCKVKK
jgi:hypothetical protein